MQVDSHAIKAILGYSVKLFLKNSQVWEHTLLILIQFNNKKGCLVAIACPVSQSCE